MIPLKNNTLFSKIFSCKCAICRDENNNPTEFSIIVEPDKTGVAICPACGCTKIFIELGSDGDSLEC